MRLHGRPVYHPHGARRRLTRRGQAHRSIDYFQVLSTQLLDGVSDHDVYVGNFCCSSLGCIFPLRVNRPAGADWLQGPYVYALYTHYGYDIQMIGILFIVGFGTAAVFGTFVGSAADR